MLDSPTPDGPLPPDKSPVDEPLGLADAPPVGEPPDGPPRPNERPVDPALGAADRPPVEEMSEPLPAPEPLGLAWLLGAVVAVWLPGLALPDTLPLRLVALVGAEPPPELRTEAVA